MKRLTLIFTLFIVAILLNPTIVLGQNESNEITIGIAGSEPFIKQGTRPSGISLDIWKRIAEKTDINYKTVPYDDIPAALNQMKAGKIDAVIGPISITAERADSAQFTQPYFSSGYSILSREGGTSFLSWIKPFLSMKFIYAISIFLLILGIVGLVVWAAERKENTEEFPADKPAKGIGNGMWLAIVTMTTTGYGDLAPKTFWGRFAAGAWMILSLVLASTMIAGIASVLTIFAMNTSSISSAEDLVGQKTAVIVGSPAEDFVKENGGKVVPIENIQDGIDKLTENTVTAMVYDRSQLRYFLEHNPQEDFVISQGEYNRQGYGFAFSDDFKRIQDINIALLQLEENGVVDRIIKGWLGDDEK